MSKGRDNRLAGQIGEYLVCAELGKRGLIATPFSGNVPAFDVLAADDLCRTVPIQVKASRRVIVKSCVRRTHAAFCSTRRLSLKTKPCMTSVRSCRARNRCQRFAALCHSLNTLASMVVRDKQPRVLFVRQRTVANVDSIGLVVRRCPQCSAGKS